MLQSFILSESDAHKEKSPCQGKRNRIGILHSICIYLSGHLHFPFLLYFTVHAVRHHSLYYTTLVFIWSLTFVGLSPSKTAPIHIRQLNVTAGTCRMSSRTPSDNLRLMEDTWMWKHTALPHSSPAALWKHFSFIHLYGVKTFYEKVSLASWLSVGAARYITFII